MTLQPIDLHRLILNLPPDTRVKFRVVGTSMRPLLDINDFVLIERISSDYQIQLGDLVLIKPENRDHFLLHRVVKIFPDRFITKGDASITFDENPYLKKNILGTATHIVTTENPIPITTPRIYHIFLAWISYLQGFWTQKNKNQYVSLFVGKPIVKLFGGIIYLLNFIYRTSRNVNVFTQK